MLSFSLAGKKQKPTPKVSAFVADDDTEHDEPRKHYISVIEEGAIVSESTAVPEQPLVIPLPPPRNVTKEMPISLSKDRALECAESRVPDAASSSIDTIAERELIAEATGSKSSLNDSAGLVITMTESTLVSRASSTHPLQRADRSAGPLLLSSLSPELLQCRGDDERFQVDLSLRPAEMDPKDAAYRVIPVESFGAAMLRGMGWTGPDKGKDQDKASDEPLVAREQRLGLGAKAKPPPSHGRFSKGEQAERHRDEWKQKAAEAIRSQRLAVADVVMVLDKAYAGKMATVEAVQGVPGLDRIR